MEAIRRPKTVMETLDEFKQRYPRERFIYVNAPLETAGPWPEHYGLGARVFRVPTENLEGTPAMNGWIYELHGLYALSKPSKLQIMHDAGVIFSREKMHRVDDGSDPDVCELEGAAAILSLSGLATVTGTKRIDRKITPKVSREFLVENCETKLELRLGWKLVGLPQAFTLAELQAKEFVTFCVFSAPHAANPEERMLILRHHLGIWGPAFGDARPIEIGTIEAPRQIEGAREEPIEIVDADDDPEPAQQDTSPGGEVGAAQSPSLPLGDAPLPPGSSKITAEKIDFLQAVIPLKNELLNLLGALKGSEEYYKLMLATTGCQHANQIPAGEKQGTFYRKLERMVKLIKENPKTQEPVKPFQEALDMARPGYAKLSLEKLNERMEAQIEIQKYPIDLDPLGINPIICTGDKAKLIDAILAVLEWGMTQTMKSREQAAADPRGGAR